MRRENAYLLFQVACLSELGEIALPELLKIWQTSRHGSVQQSQRDYDATGIEYAEVADVDWGFLREENVDEGCRAYCLPLSTSDQIRNSVGQNTFNCLNWHVRSIVEFELLHSTLDIQLFYYPLLHCHDRFSRSGPWVSVVICPIM